ncbi:Methylthioribose-1-phosphate isomerase [Poriferisphaera corsica]|uniref:Methylthioribose-1-phosphate isomerase n=1 Tax=Poriferisphaera corsica TaxID=2528020 RepID=A0A517YQ33_9BACT|nr:S-methyl-5-thioribose-1-phosphate isomerase [Poriferisphaera corsica]QDU32333.1 Methylthioribose-1-phosphate isomerase [Poriferisphaera corsica]
MQQTPPPYHPPIAPPIEWIGPAESGHLRLLDQTQLPITTTYLDCTTTQHIWDAIKRLVVRGAPAIGITAAYGLVIASQTPPPNSPLAALSPEDRFQKSCDYLATSRPTAVNLFWAIDRLRKLPDHSPAALLAEAKKIHEEDRKMCHAIGQHALDYLLQHITPHTNRPLTFHTHCNAGALATGGIGTATAPMYLAHEQNIPIRIFADETRPLLQGSRLTAFELQSAGIDVTLICDDMAAHVMQQKLIDLVIVGADRIAANGDAANKIGTYNLAVLAKHHNIPFFVAAPSSTFDLSLSDGSHIPIEERASNEITQGFGNQTAPNNIKTYSPAFDVTPHALITALITERGIIPKPNTQSVTAHLS